MEWTEEHDIQLAREVLLSEPFRFKPRTVEHRKVWQEIANRLNENRLIHFRVTKRSTREHFSLLLEKFKAKLKNEAKQSGDDVQNSELDVAIEEIWEKWQEAESRDATCVSKKQIEVEKASGEDIRRKACEKLGDTSKRNMKEEAAEVKPRKSRRYRSNTIELLREKAKQDLAVRQEEVQPKEREEERHAWLQEQFLLKKQQQQQNQMQMLNMMQQQNRAIMELVAKFTSPK